MDIVHREHHLPCLPLRVVGCDAARASSETASTLGGGRRRPPLRPADRQWNVARATVTYDPAAFSRAHSAQSGLLPVPSRRFSASMLLPVLQFVLL